MNTEPCTVYRVVDSRYGQDEALSGEGARVTGGRWNHEGTPVVYCSGNASLAMLEKLAGITDEARGKDFKLLSIHFSEETFGGVEEITDEQLPENWRDYPPPAETQDLGTQALEQEALVGDEEAPNYISMIRVPSVICPLESNLLLPPVLVQHLEEDAVGEREFTYDERIL